MDPMGNGLGRGVVVEDQTFFVNKMSSWFLNAALCSLLFGLRERYCSGCWIAERNGWSKFIKAWEARLMELTCEAWLLYSSLFAPLPPPQTPKTQKNTHTHTLVALVLPFVHVSFSGGSGGSLWQDRTLAGSTCRWRGRLRFQPNGAFGSLLATQGTESGGMEKSTTQDAGDTPSKKNASLPLKNRPFAPQKETRKSSNHPVSGATSLVSGSGRFSMF